MQRAWTDLSQAFQYAFGQTAGRLAARVVLLHKDRLREIAALFPEIESFSGRWQGIRTPDERIAFIVTPGGVADVCDCLFHLTTYPPEALFFTGTCGGITADVKIGSLCSVQKGWLAAGTVIDWMDIPEQLVRTARLVHAPSMTDFLDLRDRIRHDFGLDVKTATSFSVPFQAIESSDFIRAVRLRGADVVDMESVTFMSIAERLAIPAMCLLWCTDRPEDVSYYTHPEKSVIRIRQQLWELWPEIVGKVFLSILPLIV